MNRALVALALLFLALTCTAPTHARSSVWVCRPDATSPAGFAFLQTDAVVDGDEVVANEDDCRDPLTGIRFRDMGLEVAA